MRGHLAFQGVRGESQALRHVSYMAQSLVSAMSAIRPLYANSRRDAAMPRAVEKCQPGRPQIFRPGRAITGRG